MATICGFGTAPKQKEDGFKSAGTVKGRDADVLAQFFSDDVRLVRGGEYAKDEFEFLVMVK